VTIGRSKGCSISFSETGSSLSRVQCRIDYIDDKWIIKDGTGDKKSTNGTWLFASS
jgi:pSer/pThr/pTyr-binding forkhead associated (FHA) protein